MDSRSLERVIRSIDVHKTMTLQSPNNKEKKWLHIAREIGNTFSTCSRRQYGAVIVSSNGRIAGIGYNGSAPNDRHCNEGGCPRVTQNSIHGSNYDNCIAIHAEANALLWSDISMRNDATIVVNGPPCFSCAKLIAGSGIKTVVCEYDAEYPDFKKVVDYLMSQQIQVKVFI